MKVCEHCGIEIHTHDGENLCAACDVAQANGDAARLARIRRNARRRERDAALRSLGLVKVRGALGGTYWE